MCCQPPLDNEDIDELFERNVGIIRRAPKALPVVGITGGEPTLLGHRLIDLIRIIREELSDTEIHMLTNGRLFKDAEYAKEVVEAAEGKLTFGIPLHSDYYKDHDIIAGAKEAYNETIVGLFNLAAYGAVIELRVVMNALNYMRLPQMADFIQKNLPFVAWTAFMGMEHIGYAVSNERNIWVEPINYASYLAEAVTSLTQWHMGVAIYNIPLCLLPTEVHSFAQQSISDWKNKYLPICDKCSVKDKCCGLFATSKRIYKGLEAL
jgi:His-Xaa-Ser system radical SAM maturase HxsC